VQAKSGTVNQVEPSAPAKRSHRSHRWLLWLSVSVILIGCASPREDFDKELTELGDNWSSEIEAADGTKLEPDWEAATGRMLEQNLSLRRSREQIRRAERGIGQVYRDLIPAPDLNLRITDTLGELEDFGRDGISLSVGAFIRLSGVFYLPRNLYAARLNLIGQQLAHRIQKRERMVSLWVAFRVNELLVERRERLELLSRLVAAMPGDSAVSWSAQLEEAGVQLSALERDLQEELALILNAKEEITPVGDSAPAYEPPGETELVTSLEARSLLREVAAVDLLQAYAAVDAAKLDRWPRPDFYLYGGDFFQYRDNETENFSWDSMFATAGAYHTFDVSGRRALRVEDAQFDAGLIKERVAFEQSALLREMRAKRHQLNRVDTALDRLDRQRALLVRLLNRSEPSKLIAGIQRLYRVELVRNSYIERQTELSAFFLFHDETFWAEHTADSSARE